MALDNPNLANCLWSSSSEIRHETQLEILRLIRRLAGEFHQYLLFIFLLSLTMNQVTLRRAVYP